MNPSLLSRLTQVCIGVVMWSGLVLSGANTAFAAAIAPGFDYFTTPPGGATVDLGLGPIPLVGVPLPNFTLGLTDTVVARMDPGPSEGGTGTIDIELVALHLKSIGPVDIDGPGGAPIGDLHITIDASDRFYSGVAPRPAGTGTGPPRFDLPTVTVDPSSGKMFMAHGGPGPHTGATMRACFGNPADCNAMPSGFGLGLGFPGNGIFASAFLVIPGGDLSNPLHVLASVPAPPVTLASLGTYVHNPLVPDQYGGISLATIQHDGPHPHAEPVPDSTVVPEPTTAFMALISALGFSLLRRARQNAGIQG